MSIVPAMRRLLEAEKPKTVPIPTLSWASAKNKYDDQAVVTFLRSQEGDRYTLHMGLDYAADGRTFNGKWAVSLFKDGEGRILEKKGLASRPTAEKFLKTELGKIIAAKRFAEPTETGSSMSAEAVAALLQGKTTKTGGRLTVTNVEEKFIDIDPAHRQRLDHYGTSYSSDGDEEEGWDDEGWEEDYARPLRREVEAILKANGVTKWVVDIGEKGHVELQRTA